MMCLHPASELARKVKSVFFFYFLCLNFNLKVCDKTHSSWNHTTVMSQRVLIPIPSLWQHTRQVLAPPSETASTFFFLSLSKHVQSPKQPFGQNRSNGLFQQEVVNTGLNDLFSEYIVLDEHAMLSYSSPNLPHVGCLMLCCNYRLQEASKQQAAWPRVRSSYICLLQVWHNRVRPQVWTKSFSCPSVCSYLPLLKSYAKSHQCTQCWDATICWHFG